MKKHLYPFFAYLKYWFVKEDQFAIQSPFVFDLYNGLLGFIQQSRENDLDLEVLREKLLSDFEILEIDDFGAGSKRLTKPFRKTSSITKYSSSSRKFSQLYQYFVSQTPAEVVFELGTCVGLNTRYLARNVKGKLLTFEGSKALWNKAQENIRPENTEYIFGNLQETLAVAIQQYKLIDFALVDATHTYEATLSYFELILPHIKDSSIICIADIHWSKEMNAVWNKIKVHHDVIISLDFFECGVLLFDKKLTRGHYILHY
ncbi:Methyltransferase domain-containing protein [Aquiflexum balticum DSM 16537]|uniref:Methyltransferase domain-containing protein n=1 Tax=Aquiflexum balticum DSM 16537 TaxID=758820 RepID=A0A1W2H7C3_9BACT|nr:class I SAM-dependent methyltransferase [Aquiflexum balticum]SMD44552.1 Methyltransferase domain-containing protein [Aquiflexum balticum DSM 16537]